MSRKVTRRQWTAVMAGAASSAAAAQAPSPAPAQTAEQLLEAARQRMRRNAETLGKHKLPASTEPAFVFRP